jgi:ABC-type amino acid transport system permease subunit
VVNVRIIGAIVIGFVALAFGLVNGVLMCISPRHHTAFLRWYSRINDQATRDEPSAQIERRIAGLVIVVMCMFFGWVLAGKIVSR